MTFDSRGTLFVWHADCGALYSVTVPQAVAKLVGSPAVGGSGVGIAFDRNDVLYLKDGTNVYEIDESPGGAGAIVTTYPYSGSTGGMLAFDRSDLLYRGTRGGGSPLMTLGTPPPPAENIPTFGILSAPIGTGTGIPGLAALAFRGGDDDDGSDDDDDDDSSDDD